MSDQQGADIKMPDPVELSQAMARIAEQSQRIVSDFLGRQGGDGVGMSDPLNVGRAFLEMTARMMADPAKLMQAQMSLWQDYMNLWQATARRMMGEEAEPVIQTPPEDRRFRDAAWQENQLFDFIKQSYLLSARWMQSTVREVEGLDDKTAKKVDFYTRQFVDAMAPSNFVMTNPEVLRATVESGGENLIKGLQNLLDDLERGKGNLAIKMTDLEAFRLGENIAVTPGKVVFQNDLMQLIQYTPSTETVLRTPLLIVPPWINKYYILDLKPEKSFIKWCVDQGITVFVISWVNPDASLGEKTFEDYMKLGPLAAMDVIEKATGEMKVHALGYCVGGTLLSATLAWLAEKRRVRVASATLLTTQVDFTNAGDLLVFVDEEQISAIEEEMQQAGVLEGVRMSMAFNMLRSNDLIWPYVINNYLKGQQPSTFDLLHWNSDSTRMPAANHSYYLRNCYLENRLSAGTMVLDNTILDLSKVKIPIYNLATREDHIAPPQSVLYGSQFFGGPVRYVLAGSGHIAGVINPPATGKYQYWTNDRIDYPAVENWLKDAQEHKGSWWPDWQAWLKAIDAETIAARPVGTGALPAIEDAPGSYVRMRA